MDNDLTPRPAPGGTVEPANRATVAKTRCQTPLDVPSLRYEMFDPLNDVTYRKDTFREMAAQADKLASTRFSALDADGNRTIYNKVDGQWQNTKFLPARQADVPAPETRLEHRDEAVRQSNVVPMPGATPVSRSPTEPDEATAVRSEAQAERAALIARLETALNERYLIKRAPVTVGDTTIGRTEYRFRGDSSRVAFTESTFRLATDTNSPSVARSMVDVAEARNWQALRVSGNEDFKRLVWLEASVRGVKTLGYEPNPADLAVLKKERDARLTNRIDKLPALGESPAGAPPEKNAARGSGGRKAVLAAIEAVLVAKGVPLKQRDAVMAAASEQLAQRLRSGPAPQVKVYDPAAPSQRPAVMPTPEVQRTRERATPVR